MATIITITQSTSPKTWSTSSVPAGFVDQSQLAGYAQAPKLARDTDGVYYPATACGFAVDTDGTYFYNPGSTAVAHVAIDTDGVPYPVTP